MNGSSNCSHPVTKSEAHNVILWMGFLGLSATVVCSTAALLVFIFKLHKYFVHRLALYQVLAAFFYALALTFELVFLTVDKEEYRWLCETISFFFIYFSWVKLLFTAWVVVHLFCFTVFYKNLQNLEALFVIISIVTPLLFTWIPFIKQIYGPAGAWCWIENWKDNCIDHGISYLGVTEQFTLWYGPAMICSIVESIAIIVIVLRLLLCYQPDRDEEMSLLSRRRRRKAFKELLPLLAYPILFCVLLTPPLVNRIIGAYSTKLNMDAILASGISVPLQPFFAGLTLLIHVLVLKFPKSVLLDKCFNRRYRLMHSTDFTTEDRNSWRFTAGEQASTFCATEAIIPAESEVDTSILSQKRTK